MPIDTEAALKAKRFEATALAYMDSIYKSACRMMGNESDAQDLVQDTYLKAYRFFDTFREGTNCDAWLFAILKNTFINTIDRDRRRPKTVPLSEMAEHGMELQLSTSPEDEISGDLFSNDVAGALDELPIAYRTVVLLACVDELSYREIANTIGCPIGTVMSRLHRGRKLLRERLASFRKRRVKL